MLWTKVSLPALLSVAAIASGAHAAQVIPEPRLPLDWATEVGFAQESVNTVKFTVLVNEQNADRVRVIAQDVSDPESSNYGKYLKQAEIDELTKPLRKHTLAVRQWLHSNLPGANIKEEKDRTFTVEYVHTTKISEQSKPKR